MGGRKDRDYARLQAEFVTGEMSMRDLAKSEDIAPSSLARAFRKKDPVTGLTVYDMRDQYRASVQSKSLDLLADRNLVQATARNERILKVGDMVLDLFEKQKPAIEAQIADGKMPISVRDVVVAAELVRTVIGAPRKEESKPNGFNLLQVFGNGAGVIPPDLIGQLESAARLRVVDGRASEGPVEPDSEAASAE